MKIADLISGQVNLNALNNRDSTKKKEPLDILSKERGKVSSDSVAINKNADSDLVKIREVERNFLKDITALNGLEEMSRRVSAFDDSQTDNEEWSALSKQLSGIVRSTIFDGESVISYLSTSISDSKTLYTLKMNLENEIANVNTKIQTERKQLATFLVERENIDAANNFSAQETLDKVISALNAENAAILHRNIDNVSGLLAMDK
jgi:hypothetical protein